MLVIPRLLGMLFSFGLTTIPFIITLPFSPDLHGQETVEVIQPRPRRLSKVGYDVSVTRYNKEFHIGQDPVEF